jgi:non-homologous end joining protein Ku
MDMANKLIEQLSEKFNISKYKDTYTSKLLKIIKEGIQLNTICFPYALLSQILSLFCDFF